MFYVVPVATNVKTVVHMGLRAILGCCTGNSRRPLQLLVERWRLSTIKQVVYWYVDGQRCISGPSRRHSPQRLQGGLYVAFAE
eukprot:6183485-Pleurochrysis_carterae.AAC.1